MPGKFQWSGTGEYFSAQHVFENLRRWKLPPLARTTIPEKSTPTQPSKAMQCHKLGTGCFVQVLDGALPATAFGPLPVMTYVLVDFYKSLGSAKPTYTHTRLVLVEFSLCQRHMPRAGGT